MIITKAIQYISNLFSCESKIVSDRLMNFFLIAYFLFGIGISFYYDTFFIALSLGCLSLMAYYSTKILLPDSNLYQYVLSGVVAVYMAQFIYQMHGMFEMHFFAFIGSVLLITYRNWRLQIPLTLLVLIHHGVFAYLQYAGNGAVYFTQLDYMALDVFVFHIVLAAVIFSISGLWAYNFNRQNAKSMEQSFEIGRLQAADNHKAIMLAEREKANREIRVAQAELEKTLNELECRIAERTKDLSKVNQELIHEVKQKQQLTDRLCVKNKEMTDSIMYAEKIQQATLSDMKAVNEQFEKFFMFYQQKDIVGGDFYWTHDFGDKTMLFCGDCTGHGVPGAFMTIVAINILNRLANDSSWSNASEAMKFIDRELERAVQGNSSSTVSDGMDATLCIIDKKEQKIQFSGAMNSIALVCEKHVNLHKGDRHGLGVSHISHADKEFSIKEMDFKPGDMLYMFTDGFQDQFGGERQKKFTRKRLLEALHEVHALDAKKQMQVLRERFELWRGNLAQTDDVLLIGVGL